MMTTRCFFANFWKAFVRRAGNRFGELEIFVVFGLAEVLGAKEFLRADDLRALLRRRVRAAARVFFRLAAGSDEQAVWIKPMLTSDAGIGLLY